MHGDEFISGRFEACKRRGVFSFEEVADIRKRLSDC
jgi:hypothetical protein